MPQSVKYHRCCQEASIEQLVCATCREVRLFWCGDTRRRHYNSARTKFQSHARSCKRRTGHEAHSGLPSAVTPEELKALPPILTIANTAGRRKRRRDWRRSVACKVAIASAATASVIEALTKHLPPQQSPAVTTDGEAPLLYSCSDEERVPTPRGRSRSPSAFRRRRFSPPRLCRDRFDALLRDPRDDSPLAQPRRSRTRSRSPSRLVETE